MNDLQNLQITVRIKVLSWSLLSIPIFFSLFRSYFQFYGRVVFHHHYDTTDSGDLSTTFFPTASDMWTIYLTLAYSAAAGSTSTSERPPRSRLGGPPGPPSPQLPIRFFHPLHALQAAAQLGIAGGVGAATVALNWNRKLIVLIFLLLHLAFTLPSFT